MKYRILQTDKNYWPQVLVIDDRGSLWKFIQRWPDSFCTSENGDGRCACETEKQAKKNIDDYVEYIHRTKASGMQVKSIIDYDPGAR